MFMRFGLSSAVTALAAGAAIFFASPVLAQQPGEPVCVKCHGGLPASPTKHSARADPRSPFGGGE
jgi:hypothetical protein